MDDYLIGMSFTPNLEEQELLAAPFRRPDCRLPARETVVEILVGLAFVITAAWIWRTEPPPSFAVAPAVLCLVVLVLAERVRFDTPYGMAFATQLAFVPLLFAMPIAIVPIAVLAAYTIARLPQVLVGKTRPTRLLLAVGDSWFAIGPVAVFALAGTQPPHAGAGLLLAAFAAQCTVDFGASGLRFVAEAGASWSSHLRSSWVYAVDAALSVIALIIAQDIHNTPLAALAPLPLLALLAVLARERHYRIKSLIELNTAYRGTALVLGDVVEADDAYTGDHCKSVVRLALALADEFGLSPEQRRNLEFAALLHDVGKIAIPKEIINKPGKLDPDEWRVITTHTVEGQRMLDQVGGLMRSVGLIVRSHHERWDGTGYPDRLAGENIPLEARIISCCDAWNAMRTDRSYRKALSDELARTELLAGAGHQFDPSIVPVFLNIIQRPANPHTATHPPRTRRVSPSAS